MFAVVALLIGVAIRLYYDQSKGEEITSFKDNFMKFVFCISLAIFIPSIIGHTFGSTIQNGQIMFYPVFIYMIGTLITIGLQRMAYGRFL